jgi:hypothetical protein
MSGTTGKPGTDAAREADAAAMVSGVSLPIDGGYTARWVGTTASKTGPCT